jgi:5-methylcytosine-specific restriction endonuclease McrA
VLLLVTPEGLHGTPGAPPALLDGVGPVSPAGARQLCCDAEVTRVRVDRTGAVLDVGRARREPSARQRAAVIARDRGCVGCGAPALRGELHHIRRWSKGGRTDLENLCLLCWGCHAKAHHHGWQVRRRGDERFTLDPPAHGAARHTG